MFDHVLVGIGDRKAGRDALALAKQLLAAGGRLTLARVYLSDSYVWRGARHTYHIEQRQEAAELLESVRSEARVTAELECISSPSVGRGLHELVEQLGADLLVVGSSGRGRWGRILLGDDTRDSLEGSPCAIAVAPTGYAQAEHAIRVIGVGYNRSGESELALGLARSLAERTGARLSARQVVTFSPEMFLDPPAHSEEDFEEILQDARQRLAERGGLEAQAVYGRADDALTDYSDEVDLLVLGSRDYGPLGTLMHGSTTRQLARTARCPLLILPRGVASDPNSRLS